MERHALQTRASGKHKVLERNIELKGFIENLERTHDEQREKFRKAREAVSICAESIKGIYSQILIHNPDENTKECLALMSTTMKRMLIETNSDFAEGNFTFQGEVIRRTSKNSISAYHFPFGETGMS